MVTKGYKMTIEHKKKIGLANSGRKQKPEHIAKRIKKTTGKKRTQETKDKISNANIGRKMSEESIKKAMKSRQKNGFWKNRDKTIKKMSESNKGKKLLKKTKRKIALANLKEKSHFWKGGISFEPYSADWNELLKKTIRERDKYLCQICFNSGLCVHHIDYNKKNCNTNNLITLCRKCHTKTNFNREKWKAYFKQIKMNILGCCKKK